MRNRRYTSNEINQNDVYFQSICKTSLHSKISKIPGIKASLLAKVLMLAISAGTLASCSSQSANDEQAAAATQETDSSTISNSEMEKRLSDGSPWKRVADSLEDGNLSSISFDQDYYSMELADGEKISGEYQFLEDPASENESEQALLLFKGLSTDGDVTANIKIVQNEEGTALVFIFAEEESSREAAQKLGLTEEVFFYDQESFKEVQSKEEARQQQLERQKEAQRLREENGQNAVSSNVETEGSESPSSSESSASSTENSGAVAADRFVTSFLPQYPTWSCPGAADSSTPGKKLMSFNFSSDGTVTSYHLDGSTGYGTWRVSNAVEFVRDVNGQIYNGYAFDLIFPEFSVDGQSFQNSLIECDLFPDSNTGMGPSLDINFAICPELGKLISVNGTNLSLFGIN